MDLYQIDQYAYPALNFLGYATGYAIILLATVGAYCIWKAD